MTPDPKLTAQITEQWNIITEGQMMTRAFLQGLHGDIHARQKNNALEKLNTILIENGLLTQRPERPSERAMRVAAEIESRK